LDIYKTLQTSEKLVETRDVHKW